MGNSREAVLSQLRLEVTSGLPEVPLPPAELLFADIPSPEKLVETFTEQLQALGGTVRRVSSMTEAGEAMIEIIGSHAAFGVEGPLIATVVENCPNAGNKFTTLSEQNLREISHEGLAAFTIGITEADAFIARTGSIGVSYPDRRITLLPEHHLVIGQRSQLKATLSEWIAELPVHSNWSCATLITGPSRTSDIEKTLVLGAHGPKQLTVLFID